MACATERDIARLRKIQGPECTYPRLDELLGPNISITNDVMRAGLGHSIDWIVATQKHIPTGMTVSERIKVTAKYLGTKSVPEGEPTGYYFTVESDNHERRRKYGHFMAVDAEKELPCVAGKIRGVLADAIRMYERIIERYGKHRVVPADVNAARIDGVRITVEHQGWEVCVAVQTGNDTMRLDSFEALTHHLPPPPRTLAERLWAVFDWLFVQQ